jgi:hypothetical protein
VTPRAPRARLQSLCGTARRLRREEESAAPRERRPCRHHAIWACQGSGERTRRLASALR